MEITTALGLLVGFGSMIIAHIWENGWNFWAVLSLLNPSAALIVLGGTLGCALLGFPMHELKNLPKAMGMSFKKNGFEETELVNKLVKFAEKARREGLLSLESEVQAAGDPFLQKGIQLVADGLDQDTIREMLETEIDFLAARHAVPAAILDGLGGFAPTMGIIGTVMGLISLLGNLGGSIEQMGAGIAVAFTATLYGVWTANLLWLPMAQKLKRRSEEEVHVREIMIAGIISIQAGDNPQIVEEKLKSFLSPSHRTHVGGKKQ
ncbi:MAG: motility protein A [Candidatus Sericytochromatia bacterium]|nr:motility protein A [Candidatus Sericytochromatia bacterium]